MEEEVLGTISWPEFQWIYGMSKKQADLDEANECRARDPARALQICNGYIDENPFDSHGYFGRHLAWIQLGEYQKALADCNKVLQLDPDSCTYLCRGDVYRNLGDHSRAVADFDRARGLDFEEWRTSFGPHFRADSLARVGRLDDALADCDLISDDHWMPAHSGLPGGTKDEFIAEIRRRAAIAMKRAGKL